MTIDRFFTVPCTISTPSPDDVDSSTDDEGVPTVGVDTTETVCHVQPYTVSGRGDSEQILGREEARRARRVWFPEGTPVTFASTVTIGGLRFSLAGDPDTWNVGSPNDHIAAVIVRQVTSGVVGSSA